jgi:hypothetical protein
MILIKSFNLNDKESRPKLLSSITEAVMTTYLVKIRSCVAELKDEPAAGVQFSGPAKAAAASNSNNAPRLT